MGGSKRCDAVDWIHLAQHRVDGGSCTHGNEPSGSVHFCQVDYSQLLKVSACSHGTRRSLALHSGPKVSPTVIVTVYWTRLLVW